MPTMKAVCVLLAHEAAGDLPEFSHLMDHCATGPLFYCESVDVDGAFLKLSVNDGAATSEFCLPAGRVRAVAKCSDLAAWGLYTKPVNRLQPLAQAEVTNLLRDTVRKAAPNPGMEIPVQLLRSMCFTTPIGVFNAALAALEVEGILTRNESGAFTRA